MNRLTPDVMTAEERISEVGLILSRGIARRLRKLKAQKPNDMRDNSLDFSPSGSVHAKSREEKNNQ